MIRFFAALVVALTFAHGAQAVDCVDKDDANQITLHDSTHDPSIQFVGTEVSGATQYELNVDYQDATTDPTNQTSSTPSFSVDLLAGHLAKIKMRASLPTPAGPWADAQCWVKTMASDSNADAKVGTPDYTEYAADFGNDWSE